MLKYNLLHSFSNVGFLNPLLQRLSSIIYSYSKKEQFSSSLGGKEKLDNSILSADKLEEYLLKLCQEFEQKNKVIQIKSLYLRARRDTKVPRLKVEAAINNLIFSKKIIPGRFLHEQSVLKNLKRKRIHNLIASRPSFQALDIKTETGLGAKILAWHLKQLLDFKQIKQVNFGTKILFALPEQDDHEAIVYYIVTRSNIARSILTMLVRKPTPKSNLIEQDPAKRTTFLYHLNNLEEWKLIEIIDVETGTYQLAAAFHDSILKIFQKYYPTCIANNN